MAKVGQSVIPIYHIRRTQSCSIPTELVKLCALSLEFSRRELSNRLVNIVWYNLSAVNWIKCLQIYALKLYQISAKFAPKLSSYRALWWAWTDQKVDWDSIPERRRLQSGYKNEFNFGRGAFNWIFELSLAWGRLPRGSRGNLAGRGKAVLLGKTNKLSNAQKRRAISARNK